MGILKNKYNNLPVQVKASFWALFCGVLQKGISVITTPIFTRLLSTEEYGQFSVFNSWLSILTIFVSFNLSYGVFEQGLVKFENDKKSLASSMQGLSLTLTVFWTAVYALFHNFWNRLFGLTTVQMLAMLITIWLISVYNFWAAEQKNQYKYKALLAVSILVSIVKPVVCIVLVIFADDKVTARILGAVLVDIIVNTFMFILQMKRGKRFFSKKYWKYALLFNLPLIPHYLSQVVLNSSDRIMIEKMSGDSFAGIYSLAYSLSLVMTIINSALMQTIGPWIYKKIKSNKISDIAPIAYTSLIGVALVNFILIALAPEAVKIFAPPEYSEAIWIIPPVAISVYYIYSYDLFAKFAFYYEKRIFITFASVIGALLNVVLNYVFIGKYGYIAAGYTTLVCYIIYCVCHYVFMNCVCKKFCNGVKPYNTKIIMLISALFTVGGLLMLLTYNNIFIRYSVIAVLLIVLVIFRKTIIDSVMKIFLIRKQK